MTGAPKTADMKDLLDIADRLNVAKSFIACVFMACESMQGSDERDALCAVANAAREKLEDAIEAIIDMFPTTVEDSQ